MFGYFRHRSTVTNAQKLGLRRLVLVFSAAMWAVSFALVSVGCNSNSFLPPPPDGLRDGASDVSIDVPAPSPVEGVSSHTRSIEMILDHRDPGEINGLETAARTQAGIDKVRIKTTVLENAEPASKQAELVREAITRHPMALIIEPADPADKQMAETIEKARAEGIQVVLLNRPLTAKAPDGIAATPKSGNTKEPMVADAKAQPAAGTSESAGSGNLVLVAPPSFTQPARQLVASAIRNAKNAKLDPSAGAVIVINTIADPFLEARITAIRTALKDAGIKNVDEITFSQTPDTGVKLLKAKLAANPKLALVFAVDALSTTATRTVVAELIPERLFVQAAFASEANGNFIDMVRLADFAAVAAFTPNRVVRKAISTAVSLAQGRDLPARVEVPVEIHDSDEKSTTPQSPVYYRAKQSAKKSG